MQGYKVTSEPVIFLYTFIYAVNYLTLPQLILEKVCLKENPRNHTNCKHPEKLPDSVQKVSCTCSWWKPDWLNTAILTGSIIHPKMVTGKDILKTFSNIHENTYQCPF